MSDDLRSVGGAAVRTQRIIVRVVMRNGAIVEGAAHVKPGAYQRRVSDLLNLGKVKFIAITDATYVLPGEEATTTGCVLANIDEIVMLDVGDEPQNPPT